MPRVKRGKTAHQRRKRLLKQTKGFRWGRKSKYRLAKPAAMKALSYSYRDRKTKKRDFRRLWQAQISAGCSNEGLSYSQLINNLKKSKVELDRKILSQLARTRPDIFKKIIETTRP